MKGYFIDRQTGSNDPESIGLVSESMIIDTCYEDSETLSDDDFMRTEWVLIEAVPVQDRERLMVTGGVHRTISPQQASPNRYAKLSTPVQ